MLLHIASPSPQPPNSRPRRPVHSEKPLENARLVLPGDSDAAVNHLHGRVVVIPHDQDPHAPAFTVVMDRIADQVGDELQNAIAIGRDLDTSALGFDPDVPLRRDRPQQSHAFIRRLAKIESAVVQFQRGGVGAGQDQ